MTRRYLALLALACLAFGMPVILCAKLPPAVPMRPIPTTTLSSAVPPFTEAEITATAVQVRAGTTGQLLWQRSFPYVEYAAGLVNNGIIYRSTSGIPLVAALRADDGHLLWQFGDCDNSDDRIAILGGILYATCSNEGAFSTPLPGTPVHPVVINGSSIFSDTLYALDVRTGAVRWSVSSAHLLAVLAPGLVIAQTPVGLVGLQADSGAPLWTHKSTIQVVQPTYAIASVVVAGHGLIAYSPDFETVEALRASDGSLLWSASVGDLHVPSIWPVLAITPSVVVVESENGLVALDNASGRVRWQRTKSYTFFLSDEVSAEQVVYVGSLSGNGPWPGLDLGAYRVSDGSPIWPKSVHINAVASLLVCGTTLYAVGSTDTRALRAEDGTSLWDDTVGGDISLMAFAMPVVGIAWGGFVYLLNAPDGKLVWKVPSAQSSAGESIQVLLISQTGQSLGCGQTS